MVCETEVGQILYSLILLRHNLKGGAASLEVEGQNQESSLQSVLLLKINIFLFK